MTGHALDVVRSPFVALLLVGMAPALVGGDLSRYRDFQFGTSLATVAKQAGTSPSQAKLVHRRPALIQELAWRPQPLGWSANADAVQEVVFGFHDGALFRATVTYDRYAIEGLTAGDLVEAISVGYGKAATTAAPVKPLEGLYSDPEEILATWEDAQFRFDLLRSPYGSGFKLIGVMKRLETAALAAILEAARLDELEAPQRDAARILGEEDAEKLKLAKARLANKPKFRT